MLTHVSLYGFLITFLYFPQSCFLLTPTAEMSIVEHTVKPLQHLSWIKTRRGGEKKSYTVFVSAVSNNSLRKQYKSSIT